MLGTTTDSYFDGSAFGLGSFQPIRDVLAKNESEIKIVASDQRNSPTPYKYLTLSKP